MAVKPAHHDIRTLVSAAEGGGEQIRAAVVEVGVARSAAILADELVSRADLHQIPELSAAPILVQLDLGFDGGTVHHHIRAGKAPVHASGPAESPHATVSIELAELLRAVLGPWRPAGGQNLRIRWNDLEVPERLGSSMHVFSVVHRLVRGTTRQDTDLGELSLRHGSDKWGLHYYTPYYERYFGPFRDRPLTVLELGIGGFGNPESGGASLRMWKRYFPRAVVYGADVFDKAPIREQRLHTVQGDLSDPAFLESLGSGLGPFDIVIDDGSHASSDVILGFSTLFRHVRPGGLYVIEDLQTSYWPGYGGSSECLDDPATSMGFLKRLLDGLNAEDRARPEGAAPSATDGTVTGAHFHRSLAVLEKGVNAEGPSPSWIPRRMLTHEEMTHADWGAGLRASHDT